MVSQSMKYPKGLGEQELFSGCSKACLVQAFQVNLLKNLSLIPVAFARDSFWTSVHRNKNTAEKCPKCVRQYA